MSFFIRRKRQLVFKGTILVLVLVVAAILSTMLTPNALKASSSYSLVVLSRYQCQLKVGQSFYLIGAASNGKRITWKSSKSSVASVNTYGQVTAKKPGTCKITGKVTGGEASCYVTVEKTDITLSSTRITLENGESAILKGKTSNGSAITWKSQKSSVASVDENGKIVAEKPGETYILAKADGTTKKCKVVVKKPTITVSNSRFVLFRGQTAKLSVKTSSGRRVQWKSRNRSVATVDDQGQILALKHGTAVISISLDGVTKECQVVVKPPDIRLSHTSICLKKGKTITLTASVSSGNKPVWKSTNTAVATVNNSGKVKACQKGSCFIYVSEDGTKESCRIQVN